MPLPNLPSKPREDDEVTLVPAEEYSPDIDSFSDDEDFPSPSPSEKPTGQQQPRPSAERRRQDFETLHAEEEAERLLLPPRTDGGRRLGKIFAGGDEENDGGKSAGRKMRGRRKSKQKKLSLDDETGEGEVAELMYKVEEGGEREASRSSSGSEDARVLREVMETRKKRKKGWFGKFAAVHILILVAFIALLYGAYRATMSTKERKQKENTAKFWNGTHGFAPTTILISLDGFRADFLERNITPVMSDFVRNGVSPKYMMPSFPSLTFPNHYTLVTGMYPESHGIVGNSFWDPITEKEFAYTNPSQSMVPEWWNAEPIWVTAELQDVKTAIHMWPGSEAHIPPVEPTFVDKFKQDEALDTKIDRVVQWLDLPGPLDHGYSETTPRPQLIAFYVPNVDSDGHNFGPNSTEIQTTIADVDTMLGSLFKDIEARNLTDIVNIIIVSDHGMATTDASRLLQYEDLLDPSLIEHTDGWPLYGLRPFDHSEAHLQEIYQSLVLKSQEPQYAGTFDVYLRDENMPERYHFSQNPRIAPLWIVPKPGWAIVTKDEFDVATGQAANLVYHPRGLHGYDHEHPLMRAIFVARGPAFPHPAGSRVPPFQNIELYNIVCDSLEITPQPNNGSLRLPFQTVFLGDEGFETVEDLPGADDLSSAILPPDLPGSENLPEVQQDEGSVDDGDDDDDDDENDDDDNDNGVDDDEEEETEKESSGFQSFVDWFKGKVEDVKGWATGLLGIDGDDDDDDGS